MLHKREDEDLWRGSGNAIGVRGTLRRRRQANQRGLKLYRVCDTRDRRFTLSLYLISLETPTAKSRFFDSGVLALRMNTSRNKL